MHKIPDINIPKGEQGKAPLTVDELCDSISKANGGAKVKYEGYTPIDTMEFLSKNIEQIKEEEKNTMRISEGLRNSIDNTNNYMNLNNKPLSVEEPIITERQVEYLVEHKGDIIALANDKTLWLLKDNTWQQMDELMYPGLPQPGQ